eukprot:TRINITY_DN3241_c0_g1_i1.p1 TRINITY_DN3241_c0_g1~~TRINITY_DN3241_c0_g1_i1.p1  ORF type:complete len:387 (-),score=101.33 TRINITY_DN3241_c0_g1_i1:135-1295(-)
MDMMDEDDLEFEQEKDLSSPDVVDKYRASAEIVNTVMNTLLQFIQPGQSVHDICAHGDKLMEDLINSTNKKVKKDSKGIAFPTCVSVNNCLGHLSPLPDDPAILLKEGDLVKIDLGVQIDGYISQAAHTTILAQNPEAGPSQGKMADAICAAYFASEAIMRLIRPGKTNTEITETIKKVADVFKCTPVEGVLSHQLKRNVIDGNNVIINKADIDQQTDEFTFEANQVYCMDIVISTGEGKARETSNRTTVFKRALDRNYQLKLQASRQLFAEINKKYPILPFTLRALDEKKRRLGIKEIVSHELLDSYPVLFEKEGEFVAQFKFTVLILPNGTVRLNSYNLPHVSSEHSIDSNAEIAALLQQPIQTKKTKKNKKKADSESAMETDQ